MLLNDMAMIEDSMKIILSCWPYHEVVMEEVPYRSFEDTHCQG